MSFSYYDNNNIKKTLDLRIGQRWDEQKIENDLLSSIFYKFDDGDQIVSETEFNMVQYLLKKADSFFKQNNIIETEELNKLTENIASGEFNIKNIFENTTKNLNLKDFSLENLEKRYPKDNFSIKTYEYKDGETEIIVNQLDKDNAGKTETVLCVRTKDGKITGISDFKPEKLFIENSYENDKLVKYRNSEGEVQKVEENNVLEKLLAVLSSTETNINKIEEAFKQINKENVKSVLNKYLNITGKTLDYSIINSSELNNNEKEKLLATLEAILYEAYNCSPNFKKESSQIKTKDFYTGAEYSIEQNGDLFIITNKDSQKTTELDITKITKQLSLDEKIRFVKLLQNLPGEVLEDLAYENPSVDFETLVNAYANYSASRNEINLDELDIATFCHELGHAIDNLKNYQSKNNNEFKKAFKIGLNRFLADGKEPYSAEFNKKNGQYENRRGERENYVTWRHEELFAECYTFLMTGDCESKDCILKYFPEALDATKALLKETRVFESQRAT